MENKLRQFIKNYKADCDYYSSKTGFSEVLTSMMLFFITMMSIYSFIKLNNIMLSKVLLLVIFIICGYLGRYMSHKYIFPFFVKKTEMGKDLYCPYCHTKVILVDKSRCPNCKHTY